ncbi:MAG TPA: hypothetical protein VEF04_21265, partial [Blastocatellia bacterium]|nr:hypothetical protein [Blastocatellia bacterium]
MATNDSMDSDANEPKDNDSRVEVKVTDKRRINLEENSESESALQNEDGSDSLEREMQELRTRLQESEEKRAVAERSAEDLADRFRKV